MTDKENIKAILECYFTGFKEEIIDSACNRILEQEPCGKDINVPAMDAISRQMAIDALGECPMVWTDNDAEITAERDWKDTVEMLKSLPSVTPQSKTGHWILAHNQSKEDVLNDNYRFICSECRCSDIHAKGTKVPYCWRCGSKMEVDE